jgi:hypothetical protein
VNEIWARSVEATLLARSNAVHARELAERALERAVEASYPAAESVNLHTVALLAVDMGDLRLASSLTRRLIDGLVARGAECELRNALRAAAVILERSGDARWAELAATAESLPVVSLFSLPGHERHHLTRGVGVPMDLRAAVTVARAGLDALSKPVVSGSSRATPNEWCRDGEMWRLTYDGVTVHVRSSKGLVSIGRLLAAAGTEIHCLDLAEAGVDEAAGDEVIDARARREYERRVRELQAEVDEADTLADIHRAERARVELDALVDHLAAALGLAGRTRRQTGTTERARSTITQRIRSTIRRLREAHPSLADHLDASIQTGVFCRYRPERPTVWSIAEPA